MAGPVVLITGASGIAAATARVAAKAGASVFVVSRNPEKTGELCAELTRSGATAEAAVADVSREAEVESAVSQCWQRFGRINALFNVAGISGSRWGDGPVHECTPAGWDTVMTVNARGTFLMCHQVIARMLSQKAEADGTRGAVLNMSSILGIRPMPEHFRTHAYAASRGAVISLSLAMAGTYAPHGIRVNAIAPGLTDTKMAGRATEDPAILEAMQRKQPLTGGILSPEEVAEAAWFFLSPASRAVTGQILHVDGGWSVTG
ncbi:MAG: SDR family oxidoreductase [Betaproteobacteria bacterium]|nr:SDR family oxidoreductase [Betaproteobacteria bacterium]